MPEDTIPKRFVKRMKECASMRPQERYKCQKTAINSDIHRMGLRQVSDLKRKNPEIARIIKKFPAKSYEEESIEERMDRRMREKESLKGIVYREFNKPQATSVYADRIFRMMQKIDRNEIHTLEGAKRWYGGLKPIKEQRSTIQDRPLTESELENLRD